MSFGCWILDERKFLSEPEQALLRGYVHRQVARAGFKRGPWVRWFLVELALETGLRIGEMRALVCGDLMTRLNRPAVLVRRGKGGRPRLVRMRREFCRAVDDFFNWKQAVGEDVDADAPVFRSTMTGGHMTTRALQKHFAKACSAIGVEGHSVHHCRHTYASELLRASGGNLRVVQKQLGHANITTTQIYADVFDTDMDDAVERMYGSSDRRAKRAENHPRAPLITRFE